MSKQDAVFIGVGIYAFVATGLLWKFGLRENFGWFCFVCLIGLPLPFLIDRLWDRFA